jgi:hypothetical protein
MTGGVSSGVLAWRTAALLGAMVVIAGLVSAPRTRNERRAAVAVEPRSADELALTLELSVDVWTEQLAADRRVVVVLTPASIEILAGRGVPHRIVVADIDTVAAQERARIALRTRGAIAASWFDEYRDLEEVSDYMELLAARHPATASIRTVGASVEGRPIRAIEISRGGKIGIALDGAQHAREWISVMVPICIADRLLARHEHDPRARRILESVSFYIVPVVNPDGYAYSWTDDRYWRKNRRGGHGVDLNRNYGVAWGQAGSSTDPRSPNYRGEHAFSEPEARAMRALFETNPVRAHIDFHSYSQVVLYPWSHQKAPPPDRDRFAAIADRMSTALRAEHGEPYTIRPGSELASGIGGTLGDWAYGEQDALSFLVELRPNTSQGGGFVLPPEQIVPTCEESLAAVLELAEWMILDAGRRAGDHSTSTSSTSNTSVASGGITSPAPRTP